jgi:hypothetical protein
MEHKQRWMPIGQYRTCPLPIKPIPPLARYKPVVVDTRIVFQQRAAAARLVSEPKPVSQ